MDHNTRMALLGASALGLAAGLVGTFAALRRQALAGDALAHAALPGLAIGFLFAGRDLPVLLAAAFVAGLLGLACVAALGRWTRLRPDAAFALVLSVFFGAGIVVDSVVQRTRGAGQAGLESFLVGSTAGMLAADVKFIAVAAALAVAALAVSLKEWTLLAFDRDFLRASGGRGGWHEAAFLATLAAVTMIGLQTVGVVLMAALLILPGAAARFWTNDLRTLLRLAAAFGAGIGAAGALLSARLHRVPAGPVIVLVGTAVFLASMLFAPRRGWIARQLRRRTQREALARRTLLSLLAEDSAGAFGRSGWTRRVWRRRFAELVRAGFAGADGGLTPAGAAEANAVRQDAAHRRRLMELHPELAALLADPGIRPEDAVDPADLAAAAS